MNQRCGFVAVVGAPNAGKSTLVNALVGQKVAIVSPKAQTTRTRLIGVAIAGESQILLVDTPGIFAPQRRLDRAVEILGIGHLLGRAPATLSGGERQRVAVGRALLSRPRLLLMDEPLSALDRLTKEEILPYFEILHERLALPIVYVSHDLAEIERLADTLVMMTAGRLVAAGPLRNLQTDTRLPLLRVSDASVVLEGQVMRHDHEFALTTFAVEGGEMIVPGLHGQPGDTRRLRIAASDVSLVRSVQKDTTILNCLPARIESIEAVGKAPQVHVILSLGDGGTRIVARITRRSLTSLSLEPGMALFAQIKSVSLVAARAGQPASLTSLSDENFGSQ